VSVNKTRLFADGDIVGSPVEMPVDRRCDYTKGDDATFIGRHIDSLRGS
jgi:hypothetical protein